MKNEQQNRARDLYFNTDKTQQEIADMLDVNRRTVYLWIKQNRWDDMKTAARQAPKMILQDMYSHITAINDGIRQRGDDDRIPTMQEVEKLRKLVNITTSIQKRSTGAYVEAYQELLFYIAKQDQELAQGMLEHTDTYIRGTMGDAIFKASLERDENIKDAKANLAKEKELVIEPDQPRDNKINFPPPPPYAPFPSDRNAPKSGVPAPEINPATPEITPPETGQSCDKNAIFYNKNTGTENTGNNTSKTNTSKEPSQIETPAVPPRYPTTDFSENGISGPVGPVEDNRPMFEQIMSLPPDFRPSPYIDGDIVWVSHPDHLENRFDTYGNPWGPLKMGHSIRYYPDIDPANAA